MSSSNPLASTSASASPTTTTGALVALDPADGLLHFHPPPSVKRLPRPPEQLLRLNRAISRVKRGRTAAAAAAAAGAVREDGAEDASDDEGQPVRAGGGAKAHEKEKEEEQLAALRAQRDALMATFVRSAPMQLDDARRESFRSEVRFRALSVPARDVGAFRARRGAGSGGEGAGQGWKEMVVGRLFKAHKIPGVQPDPADQGRRMILLNIPAEGRCRRVETAKRRQAHPAQALTPTLHSFSRTTTAIGATEPLPADLAAALSAQTELDVRQSVASIVIDYAHFSTDQVLRALLPLDEKVGRLGGENGDEEEGGEGEAETLLLPEGTPTSFTHTGHIGELTRAAFSIQSS